MSIAISGTSELLERARDGDESAFARLVEPHRAELHAHCYRMLASFHDAEDTLQETLLRAWRGLSGLESEPSLRPWLYRIATNACLDAIGKRPKRILPQEYGPPIAGSDTFAEPLAESVWLEPYPDERFVAEGGYVAPDARYERREAVELAFIAALQHLGANQRAVLIMRDVLGYSARDAAEALDTSVASVNSALQRGRKTLDERLPERSQQATLRSLGDEDARRLVESYAEAWISDDFDALVEILAEDATFSMPPIPSWWRGRDAILELKHQVEGTCAPARPLATRANGQIATAWYSLDEESGAYKASAIDVFDIAGAQITAITAFVLPGSFRHFGLPEQL